MSERSRLSRRGFLRGLLGGGEGPLGGPAGAARQGGVCRPPGAASPEVRFLDLCSAPRDGCRACVDVCPERCIIPAQPDTPGHPQPGTPFLLPDQAACTLCGLCQPACPTGALQPIAPAAARIGLAVIDLERCQRSRPDGCNACVAACPFPGVAIVQRGGDPAILPDACTGCGLCAVVCPTRAIRIAPIAAPA